MAPTVVISDTSVIVDLERGAMYDWTLMCELLANQQPWWTPGTRNGYHMMTFGWTVGELVRRVSGRSLGTFFREEVAAPAIQRCCPKEIFRVRPETSDPDRTLPKAGLPAPAGRHVAQGSGE